MGGAKTSISASEYVPCPVIAKTFGDALPNSAGVPFLTAEVELAADLLPAELQQSLLPKVMRTDEL